MEWPLSAILAWLKPTKGQHSMPQNITKSAKEIVKAALGVVPAITVEEALELVGSEDHVFVDLRDPNEQDKSGRIPGAIASSRGMMELESSAKCGAVALWV